MYGLLFKETYFYPCALFLYCIDIFCFSFFEQQLFCVLLCFFCIHLYKEHSIYQLGFLAILFSLESLLYCGKFGVQLLAIIPFTFLGLHSKRIFHESPLQPYILLLSLMLIQSMILDPFVLKIGPSSSYTTYKIIANIIVLWFISLIVSSQGNLSNRFNPFKRFKEESPDS